MIRYCLQAALLLTALLALPILVIRAQPYEDRALHALMSENCRMPCFMGIRPGVSTMQEAVYALEAHDWTTMRVIELPSQVQAAVFYDAGVPRTLISWRWSPELPAWIDTSQRGALMLEDRGVRDMRVSTHLRLGEIVLAFGEPDEAYFSRLNTRVKGQFEYSAWYAREGMVVMIEGFCPLRHSYAAPVRILFRPDAPRLSEVIPAEAVCQ